MVSLGSSVWGADHTGTEDIIDAFTFARRPRTV